MLSIPLISFHTLEIFIILAGAFLLGFWGNSLIDRNLTEDSQQLKNLEEQIENLNNRINSANRSIVEYVNRETEYKRQIEQVTKLKDVNQSAIVTMVDDKLLHNKIYELEEENKLNQSNLELAAKIIDQLRDENERNRILPNHMESYMSALTESNSQVLQLKNELENCKNNLATAEQIIEQLRDKNLSLSERNKEICAN